MKFSFLLLPAALLIAAAIPGARAGSPLPGDIDQNDDEAAYEAAHAKTYALLDYVRNHSKEDALADGFGIAYLPFENLDAAKKFLAENATPLEAGNGAQYEVVADGDCATIALHGVDSYSQKFCAGDKFRFKGKEYSVAGVPPAQGLVTNGIVFRTDKYVSHPVILLRDQEGRGLVTTTDWLRPVKSLLDTSFTSTKGHAGSQCNGIMLFHPDNKKNGEKPKQDALAEARAECEAPGKGLDESTVKADVKNDANCFELGTYWTDVKLTAKCK